MICGDPGISLVTFAAILLMIAIAALIGIGAGLACVGLIAAVAMGLGLLWKRNAWR